MKKFHNSILLTIKGPFLTASGTTETYGFNKSFRRNHSGHPEIAATHIKGKLRMALEELASISALQNIEIDIPTLFGSPSDEGSYEPNHGILQFDSFILQGTNNEGSFRARISINPTTLTASDQQLRNIEDLFASNTDSIWKGKVEYHAEDLEAAKEITKLLALALQWLPNIGAEKGVGFGRLSHYSISLPETCENAYPNFQGLGDKDTQCQIIIRPQEAITIGGVKKRKTNFVKSEKIFTGGLLKGALTAGINRGHNIKPIYRELSSETADDYPDYKKLVEYFEKIRITHAFPTKNENIRPVKIPISTVEFNHKEYDVALAGQYPMYAELAPTYFIDWKNGREYFDEVYPEEIYKTNVEIDDNSRRSREGQLFSYSSILPEDRNGDPIYWVSYADFSEVPESDRAEVMKQFGKAASIFLDRIGKKNSRTKVDVVPDHIQLNRETFDDIYQDKVIIVLQSDTIMLDPEEVRKLSVSTLQDPYKEFWEEISNNSLKMIDFYASQSFMGGYIYHRYLGTYERKIKPDHYYPYYLTKAGSVFIFQVENEKAARKKVEDWKKGGLPLPKWAVDKYREYNTPEWKTCPFIPQNGFGEIIVNLKLHWENQVPMGEEK